MKSVLSSFSGAKLFLLRSLLRIAEKGVGVRSEYNDRPGCICWPRSQRFHHSSNRNSSMFCGSVLAAFRLWFLALLLLGLRLRDDLRQRFCLRPSHGELFLELFEVRLRGKLFRMRILPILRLEPEVKIFRQHADGISVLLLECHCFRLHLDLRVRFLPRCRGI